VLPSYTIQKNLFKWIKYLNITPENVKFLEDNLGENLLDIVPDNNFVVITPKAQATKAKIK
jgi:hypothetical protein